MPESLREETVKIETIHRGRNFELQRRTVRLQSGRETTRDILDHPGAVAIIPLLDDGTVVMVEQYRTAAGKTLLEVPAGTLNRNEDPEECARRELVEETGYYPKTLRRLLTCYTAPGYSSEKIHFYVATDLTYKGQRSEEDEDIVVQTVKLKDLKRMIENGEIEDMKTVCSILRLTGEI